MVVRVKDGCLQLVLVQTTEDSPLDLVYLYSRLQLQGLPSFRKLLCLPICTFFLPFFSALPLLLMQQYSRTNFICCSFENVSSHNRC